MALTQLNHVNLRWPAAWHQRFSENRLEDIREGFNHSRQKDSHLRGVSTVSKLLSINGEDLNLELAYSHHELVKMCQTRASSNLVID